MQRLVIGRVAGRMVCRWQKLIVGLALAAGVGASGSAVAQCTDTFNTSFVGAGALPPPALRVGTAYQNIFPLGVGSSINGLVSTMNTVNTSFLSGSAAFVSGRGEAQADQMGGGVWARAVVGGVESKSATTGTVDASRAKGGDVSSPPVPVTPVTGVGTCKGTVKEDYIGYQFGYDLASLNVGGSGSHLHFGLTGGVFHANTRDTTPQLSWFKDPFTLLVSPAGSFEAQTQVPYVALYSVLMQGNFVADAFVRQDFYLMELTDPGNGLSSQTHTARGLSIGASMAYRIALPGTWFIEPSVGGSWSNVNVGRIDTPGFLDARFASGISNIGSVQVNDIESLLGRITVRTGFTTKAGDTVFSPFVVGTIFHEFASEVTSTSRIGGPPTTTCAALLCEVYNPFRDQVLNTSTSRVGTFGQVGLGTAAAFADPRWSAFVRVDYRFGDSVEGYGVNGGLRFQW